MYVTPEQSEKIHEDLLKNINQDYSEKFEFLKKLLTDDDWSFIIKSHSLIESLVTELIVNKIDENKLKAVIERIPLHGEIVSKISISKTYELIPSDQIKFLKNISEIRNNIVHKFENLNFTFETYLSNLDKNQKKNWKNSLIWKGMNDQIKNRIEQEVFQSPKIAIWLSISSFVNYSLLQINTLKGNKRIDLEAMETTKRILKDIK
ncbi:hypothetical protein [Thalassobellus suaedae]|uniref:DUF4145 domain-containing protein n=1 Tax=Thalassobellus suaedae TaxID=3074124 RepID=A0ABY9XYH5_9FLAO|nr:hypothetical protein RHP51_09600 [Flavobacteriaceae bacterium HL-DH14]